MLAQPARRTVHASTESDRHRRGVPHSLEDGGSRPCHFSPERCGPAWPTVSSSVARASTTSRTSRSTSRVTPSSSSPGLSGSGKSSLAFDTIFAEGQRRYVESLSSYARQFLGQMDKPDVDFIEGLSPAVSIDQKSTSRNPRSTVGTITEVYDYLRLLFARIGKPHCPECGRPISRQSPQAIVDKVLELPEGSRFQVLSPLVRERKGEFVDLFADLQTKGYSRARVDGADRPAHRAAHAEEAGEAHHRGGRRPPHREGQRQAPAHRLGRDRARACPAAWSCSTSSTCPRTTPSASGCTPSICTARTTTCPSRSWSRAPSPSTRPSAPAPTAPASARAWRSTPS